MSKVMRSVKNVTKGYSSVQVKVREATSNDPWGPTGTQMSEIAQLTYNSSTEFYDIVDMLDKRLNDKGKNWRHVLKALKVLDYCLHEGSELIVTWARKNIFIVKTLREFVYIDEEGRDVGQNVRVAAKELTALILDEERLRAERSDRKTWKSRVTGIEEFMSDGPTVPAQRRQRPRRSDEEDDAEYKLAIEASKFQEEEDRRKRESRQGVEDDDDDLAKAIKLSKEEEERRRRELEDNNASSLFDDDPAPSNAPQPTGMNMGYQQGSNVDWLGNPIDQNQMMQPQPTGYMNNAYTGFPANNGYSNGFNNGFAQPQPTGMFDPYGQQQNNSLQPPQQQQQFQMQPTGYNPYGQQPQFQPQPTASPEPAVQPGSNNPWASNGNQGQSALKPTPTGSNNPFATGFGRPQPTKAPTMPTLSSLQALPEQKSLQTFTPPPQPQPSFQSQPSFSQPQQPQKQLSEHEQRLNNLLASGDGMDTFGNTGDLRIPAQHTAPGTFVNSAGANANKLTADATGNNPFLRQQFTGMPSVSYGAPQMPAATGPVGMNGYGAGSNPFAARPQQGNNNQGQDLIQF
ncbi:ENTH-domain-containing protein [Hypoxylon trugodes]|uniref:ENTH-domain-containing protein n=1 Tax=Hypoxylon trugodes TaxID=326681 RepID=UPI00219E1598|nr:ENTH-domain-containing protein [Hypoxylon trugodes]KAI1387758.1 ENTH-domain-containing protein [Hypoxylon trugodes]